MNENDLKQVADDLNNLALDETATLHYDVMSDALIWSDERPRHRRVRELWCLRPVFRYRTGLILGLQFSEFRQDWDAGIRFFPQWVGFRRDRSSRDIELEKVYRHLSKQ